MLLLRTKRVVRVLFQRTRRFIEQIAHKYFGSSGTQQRSHLRSQSVSNALRLWCYVLCSTGGSTDRTGPVDALKSARPRSYSEYSETVYKHFATIFRFALLSVHAHSHERGRVRILLQKTIKIFPFEAAWRREDFSQTRYVRALAINRTTSLCARAL